MASVHAWKYAKPPNYDINVDKLYPYSEVPFLGEYNLLKIPSSVNEMIEHIDYWGEGRITVDEESSGFVDCYNINHENQLVSKGSDIHRKIPNRIPVISYDNCDTSSYIKNNSVKLVTIMGAPINGSCAKDVGRIISSNIGRVIVYGFDKNSESIKNLEEELNKIDLFYCKEFSLSKKLQDITLFHKFRAYLNLNELCDYLCKSITKADYDNAITKTKFFDDNGHGSLIFDVVTKLLTERNTNTLNYAYQLWNSNAKDTVANYFPTAIQKLFNSKTVVILNKYYNLALKLDAKTDSYNDRLAWGSDRDQTSIRVKWKFAPIWKNNSLTFKIVNIEHEMYLKMDVNTDDIGDRKVWGAKNSDEERFEWMLQPVMINYQLTFLIINKRYNQGLKLGVDIDEYKDRLLWGHNGTVFDNPDYFGWYIS